MKNGFRTFYLMTAPALLGRLAIGLIFASPALKARAGSASGSNTADYPIQDGTGIYAHSPITISGAPSGATVTRIDYFFYITHPYGSEVDVDLNDHTQTGTYHANLWTGVALGGADSGANPSRSGSITSGSLIGLPVNQTWYLA